MYTYNLASTDKLISQNKTTLLKRERESLVNTNWSIISLASAIKQNKLSHTMRITAKLISKMGELATVKAMHRTRRSLVSRYKNITHEQWPARVSRAKWIALRPEASFDIGISNPAKPREESPRELTNYDLCIHVRIGNWHQGRGRCGGRF